MNKTLSMLAALVISGCSGGSGTTDGPITPTQLVPEVGFTHPQPSPIVESEVAVDSTVTADPVVEVSQNPFVPEPLVVDDPPVDPTVTAEPVVVVSQDPITPEPVVVDDPPVDNSVPPDAAELPEIEAPIDTSGPVEVVYNFTADTKTIIDYLDNEAHKALNEVNQAYFSESLSRADLNCIGGVASTPFVAHTGLDCISFRLTSLGVLSTVGSVRSDACVATLTAEFDSRNCEISSTAQSLNAEYEVSMHRDGSSVTLYVLSVEAPLGEDMCLVSIDEGTSSCPGFLYDMAEIIRASGYL